MYRVLVPIDDDEKRALAQARAVAGLPDATGSVTAVLLHVFDDEDRAEDTSPLQLESGKRANEYLLDEGVAVEAESAHGDPVETIIRMADELHADSIVLGGRKRSSVGALLFGSVSQAVTLASDLPVMITGDSVRGRPTYVCQSCGARYYTDGEITKCNECGGVKIERVGRSEHGERATIE